MDRQANDNRQTVQSRLDRHAVRRAGGVPTVSALVGPVGEGRRAWTEWATRAGLLTLSAHGRFPSADWLATAVAAVPLPPLAIGTLASRLGRDREQLLVEWRTKTPSDRERSWGTAPPHPDDDVLRAISLVPGDVSSGVLIDLLRSFGDRGTTLLPRTYPEAKWPGVMFVAGTVGELTAVAVEVTTWAVRVPSLSSAVVVPEAVWAEYLRTAPESRAKAILREGEVEVHGLDAAAADQLLTAAGVTGPVRAAIATGGADEAVVAAAEEVARATATRPESEEADTRARSAAEAFLFRMLESLPETAGRFEPNAELDFRFGPRAAEVDLLCRGSRLVIEIDGYYHFGEPTAYRRDRTKDWELQRRGFIILRFLADDVLPRYEEVRDRILDAVRTLPPGAAECPPPSPRPSPPPPLPPT